MIEQVSDQDVSRQCVFLRGSVLIAALMNVSVMGHIVVQTCINCFWANLTHQSIYDLIISGLFYFQMAIWELQETQVFCFQQFFRCCRTNEGRELILPLWDH